MATLATTVVTRDVLTETNEHIYFPALGDDGQKNNGFVSIPRSRFVNLGPSQLRNNKARRKLLSIPHAW
jgi:hypothetical protein